MVDIQSPTDENRRGKKETKKEREREGKKKPQDENIIHVSVTQGGHNESLLSRSKIHVICTNTKIQTKLL